MAKRLHKMVNGKKVYMTKKEEAEIRAEWAANAAEAKREEYKLYRVKAYPSIRDQLDTLYHYGYDAWKAEIAVVKAKYPKYGE
jgi:hypothetical protein